MNHCVAQRIVGCCTLIRIHITSFQQIFQVVNVIVRAVLDVDQLIEAPGGHVMLMRGMELSQAQTSREKGD